MTERCSGERCPQCAGVGGGWTILSVLLGTALAVGAILWLRGRGPVEIGLASGFSVALTALACVDLRCLVIPNRLVYPALAAALLVSGAWPDRGPGEALAGGLGAFATTAVIRTLSRGALGGGDVKLAALCGAVVGSPGVLAAGLVAVVVGGAAAAVLVLARRVEWSARLPYGPFLALGSITALLG